MTRPNLRRIAVASLLSAAALAAAAWFGGRAWLASTTVPTSGVVDVAGLDGDVAIRFDARGIPRIRAATDSDALFALGWLHAAERAFQMELLRRVAAGEVASLVGEAGLDSDLLHRRLGFARRIRENPPELAVETRALLEAYVEGINARLAEGVDSPAMLLLGREVRPWTVADVLMLAYYQTWYPTTLVQRMSEAWREAAAIGGPTAPGWLQDLPAWGVPSVPAQRMTEASNTWAVAPARSASGHALHASDPHLDTTMAPGLWYAAGVHSAQGLDVLGVTVPGLPFVAMGHNGRIAFAFTVAPVDLFETLRFRRDDDRPGMLVGPDGPFSPRIIEEHFEVQGWEHPARRELVLTPWGPIMAEEGDEVLVLRWAGFELPVSGLIESALALNRASDFASFRAAASDMGALSVNWSYSDRSGNIGYVQSTPVPIRTHETFYRELEGAEADAHWAGFLAPQQRPWALNPEQGWLANSNNHAAVDHPVAMPGFYKHLRMRRAVAWLDETGPLDRATMHAMQMDRVSERALAWKDWLADVAEQTGRQPLAAELRDWDGAMAAGSRMAGLFARWWQFLPRHLFGDGPFEDWRTGRTLLDDWLMYPPGHRMPEAAPPDRAAARALDDALKAGVAPLGAIQTLTIAHPLARSGLLDAWLDLARGPMPIGGGPGSLNVTYHRWDPATATLSARAGASMRFVMDWADPDAFTLNLTMGQSGHPLSPHFDDFLPSWLDGTPWIVPWSEEAVEERTVGTLRLRAAPSLERGAEGR
ncbi:MAG: penicillin acylase family protein [Wenzhouxiangellaceae bacterium]|nr:penicillin acylase family protein [Wenzhouxiangellaceae bacterium]